MTANQINYWALQETKRSNLAKEGETHRSNVAKETETNRSNLAKEIETNRSNLANERNRDLTLIETNRHNLVTEGQKDTELSQKAETILDDRKLKEAQILNTYRQTGTLVGSGLTGIFKKIISGQ